MAKKRRLRKANIDESFEEEFNEDLGDTMGEELEQEVRAPVKLSRREREIEEYDNYRGVINEAVFGEVGKNPKKDAVTIGDKAADLVETALNAGIVHKVKTEAGVQTKILKTADKMISTNLAVAESRADKKDKEAFFDANRDACSYFGYDEVTTARTHVAIMKGWSWIFNLIYLLTIGIFVVAPIVFFITKISVVIKRTWIAFLLGLVVYGIVLISPFLVTWLGRV